MGTVQFWDNVVLFDSSVVAMHADCCCGIGNCENCDGGTGPEEIEVTLSGAQDGANCNCTDWNGTHTLSGIGYAWGGNCLRALTGSSSICVWTKSLGDWVCYAVTYEAHIWVVLGIEPPANTNYWLIGGVGGRFLGTFGAHWVWEKDLGTSKPDCFNFDDTLTIWNELTDSACIEYEETECVLSNATFHVSS